MAFGITTFDSAYAVEFARRSVRRNLAYQNANGSSPLVGLLSLMDTTPCDSLEPEWGESRLVFPNPKGLAYGGNGALADNAGAVAATLAVVVGSNYRIRVTSLAGLGVGDMLYIQKTPLASGTIESNWQVVAINETTKDLTVTLKGLSVGTSATLDNAAAKWTASDSTAVYVLATGKAMSEGSSMSLSGIGKAEVLQRNYCQTFRDGKGWTNHALQAKSWFEPNGTYANDMKRLGRDHLVKLEQAFLMGTRSKFTNANNDVVRTMGGFTWFLKEWEAANGGVASYRPGEAALTSNSEPKKRIINLGGTALARTVFEEDYCQRMFSTGTSPSFEKLALCGPGVIPKLNTFYGDKLVRNSSMREDHSYSMMNMWTLNTSFGDLHFKTHPLFAQSNVYRNDMFIIDVGCLKYRHMPDRDTHVNEEIQAKDYDGRIDEYFTECTLEMEFPENHMWIRDWNGLTNS